MSGRIWVVEVKWVPVEFRGTRAEVRHARFWMDEKYPTRVVQYVRQGGAR